MMYYHTKFGDPATNSIKCTRVVQKVLQMLGFHRYKHLILAKFVMLE